MSQISSSNSYNNESDVFESLYSKFSEEFSYHVKTKILNSIVQIYLLQYKEQLNSNTKSEEFFDLLSQIPSLCSKFLKTSAINPNLLDELENDVTLENKNENLESANLCFEIAATCLEALCLTRQGLIMLKISLNILSQGYTHCKMSEQIYGDLLEKFGNQLGIFFKKIESLQMVVMQDLEKLDIQKYSDDDLDINNIVSVLGNFCQIVFSLDADIAFELWGKYIRIVTDFKCMKSISNINSLSCYLSEKNVEVLELIKFYLDKNSDEDDELCAKFFFYFDALSNLLVLAQESFKEDMNQFLKFLLNLFDCIISSYSPFVLQKSCLNIVRSSLEKNTFKVISILYSSKEFLETILITAPDKQNKLIVYLLKISALQFMENSSLLFKKDIFMNILSNVLSANSEDDMKFLHISIPDSIMTENKSRSISLYQFSQEQLREFLKFLPDSTIQELEKTIYDCLTSCSDVFYLLISDVWIYRLRCSNIEFMMERCRSALFNYSKNTVKNIKIKNLIKRMLKFLPDSHKAVLWREFAALKSAFEIKTVKHRYGFPDISSTEVEIFIESEDQVQTMMKKLNENTTNDVSQLVQKACTCLELCALFVNIAESAEVLLFTEFAFEMFKSDVYEIQIAVLTFIRALSRKTISEKTQDFGRFVSCLAHLFSNAMLTNNYMVRYEARNVFSYFAKCTPHIKIVQETVRFDPSIKPALKAYMNAVPDYQFSSTEEKTEYLQKQVAAFNHIKFEIPSKIIETLQQLFSNKNLNL